MPIHLPCANPGCGLEIVISERSEATEIRCPGCGLVQPVPARPPIPHPVRDATPQPPRGRKPMPIAEPPPKEYGFIGDGLRSILYALRALPKMLVILLALSGGRILYDIYNSGLHFVAAVSGICLFQILVPLVLGTMCYAMIGLILRYFLDVAVSSLERVGKTPDVPRLGLGGLFEYGVNGLGVLVLYVLPVVTLPLLPLALLALTYSEDTRAFDVRWAFRAAWRFPRPLIRFWAMVIFWCGALTAAGWGLSWGMSAAMNHLIATAHGAEGPLMLAAAIDVLGAVALALVGCVFLCILFRCVGLLGHYHPEITDTLPEKPPAGFVLVVLVGAGIGASFLANYTIYRLLGAR